MVANTALSDVGLRSLQPPERGQVFHWDSRLPSFGVRLSQGGSKTFILKRRNQFITIGRFPIISLAEARTEAKRLLAEFTLGKVRPQPISYAQAVEVFLEDKTRTSKARTLADYKRLLNRLAFKGQLSEITHAEAMRRLNTFKSEGERNHLLVAAKVFFNWCIKRRYITENPLSGLSHKKSETRARVLTDYELRQVWTATEECGKFGVIVKLLMLTGQRRGEIAALRKEWIGNDTVTLPKEITKNGKEHAFPIGALTQSLLTSLENSTQQFYFPARGRNSPFNGWSKSKVALDELSGISGWTLHDLRRTFATNLQKLGVRLEVIETLLNHLSGTKSGVAGIYQRHDYTQEMRAAMELWEERIGTLCVGRNRS
jgi:integrase